MIYTVKGFDKVNRAEVDVFLELLFFSMTTWPASWETCMQVKKQQLELDMEQWTASKLGKASVKAI